MKPELKDLAEESAEFLGIDRLQNSGEWKFEFRNVNYLLNEKDFYDEKGFAPILMHLAQVELEKRGVCWTVAYTGHIGKSAHVYPIRPSRNPDGYIKNENKFFAFWSAVHEAMKGEGK